MRLLADSSLHGAVVRALRAAGHDIDDVRSWDADPGDAQILGRAVRDERIVVTSDKDFGELVIFAGSASAGVVVIAQDMTVADQVEASLSALKTHGDALGRGALANVSSRGVRVRRLKPP